MAVAGNERTSASSTSPQFMRDATGTYEYGILITLAWNALLWRRKLSDNTYSTFDLSTIIGNPLNLPIKSDALGGDSHWTLGIGVDSDNRVHIMGNSHADAWYYAYKDVTVWPPSTTWTSPAWGAGAWAAFSGTGLQIHTYAFFVRMADGKLVLFADQEDSAVALEAGRDFTAWYLSPGSSTWAPLLGTTGEFATTQGNSEPGMDPTQPDRIYLNGVITEKQTNGGERLHVMGLWARRDPASFFLKREPFYLYTDTLGSATSWCNVQGSPVTMPLTYANRSQCEVGSVLIGGVAPEWSETQGVGLAIDSSGYPHSIFSNRDSTTPAFVELYFDGATWQSRDVFSPGSSSGPGIFAMNGSLYTVTAAQGRLRIRNVVSHAAWLIGNPVENGIRPHPEPTGITDQDRLGFLIPDGDTPAVFEFGDHKRATATTFNTLTLAAGNNNNVTLTSPAKVSGPNAAFTITGITAGTNGQVVSIWNFTGFNMTISQEDANSTAANRISSATQTTTGNGSVALHYSTATSRWIIDTFNS